MAIEKPARKPPKGGRKGGTTFPRMSLKDALEYSRRLVSKTHTGPQQMDSISAGVLNAKGGLGAVRLSALRQYGLLEGTSKDGFQATELARKIAAAHQPDTFLRQAALKPRVFQQLFETFHGDTVSTSKLRQRVSDLKVHPDELDSCVTAFLESVIVAKLGESSGDQIKLIAKPPLKEEDEQEFTRDEPDAEETAHADDKNTGASGPGTDQITPPAGAGSTQTKPGVTVNITVDSTMDPDKLAKQLELLKKFGAL
jgi:hypothetical protein